MRVQQLSQLWLKNLCLKFFGYTGILFAYDEYINPVFSPLRIIFLICAILALIGAVADLVVVPKLGNFPSLLIGGLAIVCIIWSVSLFSMHPIGIRNCIFVTLPLGPFEYYLHRWILRELGFSYRSDNP